MSTETELLIEINEIHEVEKHSEEELRVEKDGNYHPKDGIQVKKGKSSKYGDKTPKKFIKENRQRMKENNYNSSEARPYKGRNTQIPYVRPGDIVIRRQDAINLFVDVEVDILPNLPHGLRRVFWEEFLKKYNPDYKWDNIKKE